MNARRHLFGNASIYLASTVANAAIPFLLLPVLTRYLTPADYGVVAMFGLMLTIFGAFAGLSVHGAVSIRYFQLAKEELAGYVGTCVGILAASTAVVALAVVALGDWLVNLTGVPGDWLIVAVGLSGLQFLINIRLALWQAAGKARSYGAFLVGQSFLNATASLGLILLVGLTWEGRLLGQLVAMTLFGGIAARFLLVDGLLGRSAQWHSHLRDALKFGVPMIPHVVGGLLIVAADRLVIVHFLGVSEAGIYMVALQMGQAIGLLTDSFNKAYAPWLMKQLSSPEATQRVVIVRGTYLYYIVILGTACLYGLFAPALLEVLVGRSFRAAGDLVTYLAVGYAFGGCYFMVTNYIFRESKTYLIAGVTLASGLLNVLLTIVLVQRHGLSGAGLSFMATNAVSFLGTWWLAHRVHPMPWLDAMRPRRELAQGVGGQQ